MAGYTPVFDSVFQGSLCGHYPETAAWLFLLALADKNGCVDASPQFISVITGMPVSELEACIRQFCEPDPNSRTPDDEGRRLELIDSSRPWGWRIINHGKYREKARLAAKSAAEVESGRNAARLAQTAGHRRSPPVTAGHRPSNADADSDADSNKAEEAAAFDTSECPRDMDPGAEHRAFCLWCSEKGYPPSGIRWLRWIWLAKESGRYAKLARQPPPEPPAPPEIDPAFRAKSLKCSP